MRNHFCVQNIKRGFRNLRKVVYFSNYEKLSQSSEPLDENDTPKNRQGKISLICLRKQTWNCCVLYRQSYISCCNYTDTQVLTLNSLDRGLDVHKHVT